MTTRFSQLKKVFAAFGRTWANASKTTHRLLVSHLQDQRHNLAQRPAIRVNIVSVFHKKGAYSVVPESGVDKFSIASFNGVKHLAICQSIDSNYRRATNQSSDALSRRYLFKLLHQHSGQSSLSNPMNSFLSERSTMLTSVYGSD